MAQMVRQSADFVTSIGPPARPVDGLLITRTLIEVVRGEARVHAHDDAWVRCIAKTGRNSYREMRVRMIDLLDSDPRASIGDFSPFLDPLIHSWNYDLDDFTLEVELANGVMRRFGFREKTDEEPGAEEPGLRTFLRDSTLSSGATAEEIAILRRLGFPSTGRPTALFYYRTLQSLRDPLHFRPRREKGRRG
jgi:hypothetical protein